MPSSDRSSQASLPSREDDSSKPLSLAAVAEMAGWWPGMGCILLPQTASNHVSGNATNGTTLWMRTVKSIEEVLMDNFGDADCAEFGFTMMTGSQRRFLQALAKLEHQKCRSEKRKGSKFYVKDYLEKSFPAVHVGRSFKPGDSAESHITEKVVGYNEKGEPEVDVTCWWSPARVCSKVQQLLRSPSSPLTIAEFCLRIGTTQDDYCEFMKQSLTDFDHEDLPCFYFKAAYYFAERDEGLVPINKRYSTGQKLIGNDTGGDSDRGRFG